jgi:hypothetical protein
MVRPILGGIRQNNQRRVNEPTTPQTPHSNYPFHRGKSSKSTDLRPLDISTPNWCAYLLTPSGITLEIQQVYSVTPRIFVT